MSEPPPGRIFNYDPVMMLMSSKGMLNEGWYDDAIDQCLSVLNLDAATAQNKLDAKNMIACTYFQKKDYPKAIEWFRKADAVATDPEYCATIKCGLGNVFYEMGDKHRAKKMYKTADQILRTLPDAKNDTGCMSQISYALAQVARDERDYELAERKCRESIELREKHDQNDSVPSALDLLGTILSKRGKYDDAIEAFDKGLKLQREITLTKTTLVDMRIVGHKADVLTLLRREDEAIRCLREHLKIARELYGNSHGSVMFSMYNLARHLFAFNMKIKEADKLLKDSWNSQKE